jgi:hypothetical protein
LIYATAPLSLESLFDLEETNHLQLKKPTFKVRRLFGCSPKKTKNLLNI